MFEVGVSNSVKNLDNVKKLLDDFINEYSKGKAIKLRIEIDNLKTITDALSQIGDSSQLRNLRQEIEALNREFAKLAVGAGGKGDMGVRGMNQEVEDLKGKWESAIRLLTRYNEELDLARRNRDATSNPIDRQGYTDQINKLKEQIKEQQGFVKSAKQAYDDAVASAGKVVEANAKVAASTNEANTAFEKIKEETSSTKESVDALSKSVTELVTQLQNTGKTNGLKNIAESSEKSAKSSKEAAEAKDTEAEKERKLKIEEETRLRLLKELEDQIKRIANIENSAKGLGLDTSAIGAAQKAFGEFFQTMSNVKFDPQVFRATFSRLKTEFRDVVQEADKFNKSTDKSSSQAESRIRKLGMAFNELKNYMKQNGGSEEMKRLQAEIQGAIQKMRQLMNAGDYKGAVNVYERLAGVLRQASTATKEFDNSQHNLASTVNKTNSNLQGQSQVLSDLKTMAMQYLSVWGAQTFIHNIIELGGQLEQQRLSIGAILQDTAQANHLFGQIKSLAVKSPFGVQQLDAMSKQLSAYGFQYSELYEWTKRLADISAATGTSVDRLALALGHVRSEGALSGYTLRQFSMGNIPLLQKLSENLGKTKQEIRKMTRNKEIGYEDVLNVLKQLTDEGGMFFEAQETMAEALNAKFKNLRDSFQIMYSEMAEGAPGDFLKGVAEVLTDISKSWRVLMPLIISGGAAFGVWKGATMLVNYELAKEGVLTSKAAAEKAKYIAATNAQIATTGRWTLALKGLGRAMMGIGKFLFSPWTLGFAAIEGLIYLWSKHNEEVRRASDLTKAFGETAVESEKNIGKILENVKPYSEGMDESRMKAGIDSMTEAIKNYGVNGQKTLNDITESATTVAEKYKSMREELEKTNDVYKEMKRTSKAFEYGINQTDKGWFDDNVETNLTQYAEALKGFEDEFTKFSSKYGDALKNAVDAATKADPAFAEATKNMDSYSQKLVELWANADKYKTAMAVARPIYKDTGWRDVYYGSEGFLNLSYKRREAMKELDDFMANTESKLKEQGYDFTKELAPEQVGNLLKQSKDWMEKHPEWENIYNVIEQKLEKRWGIKFYPDVSPVEEHLPEWMKAFQNELEGTGIELKADMSMEQIFDAMKKGYDTAQAAINKLGPLAFSVGLKLDNITAESIAKFGMAGSKDYNPELYAGLSELLQKMGVKSKIDTAGKKRGWNFGSVKKDGSHKAEKQNQEAAKAVREQVRIIKEAADAFQYWREKVGDKSAWEHVQSEFGEVLKDVGITAKNIEDVRSNLDRIPTTKKFKQIKDEKIKREIKKEIGKEQDQYNRKDFERDTEKFLSETEIKLDSLTRAWEKFNTVREATGNLSLAINIAGVKYQEGQRTLADAVRQSVEDDFKSFGVQAIPFSVELDKESIKRQIQEAFAAVAPIKPVQGKDESAEDFKQRMDAYNAALATHEARIKGVVTEYEKWQELQKQIEQADLQVYANLTGSAVDLTTELQKINDEYLKQLDSLNRLKSKGVIKQDQYNQSRSILDANTNMKLVQAKESYKLLVDGVITMNKNAARIIKNEYADALEQQLKAGAITAKDYADKIDEINKKMNDLENAPSNFKSFMEGGLNGLIQNLSNRGKSMTEQGASLFQQGFSEKDEKGMSNFKKMFQGQDMMKMGKNMSAMSQGMSSTANTIGIIIKALDDFAKGLRETFETMRELAESAGSDTHTSSWNTWDTMTSGFSRTTGNISKAWNGIQSGDIGAVLSGAVGTFVSPIIEYNKGHDRLLSYRIEDLTKEVKVIESDLAMIKRFRERNLGYDTGEARKLMSEFSKHFASYTKKENLEGDVATYYYGVLPYNMANYYNYDEKMNGYMQELEDLRSKRDKIAQQYSNELDKKNSSDEALREYQDQISELDEQIMYFTQDLSKELWDIDFKSWATQFSDALWTAFENGEDAAQAFHDTAEDIIADVAKRMMTLSILEPMFNRLQKELFGEYDADLNRYVGGKIKYDTNGNIDMEGSQQDVLAVLGKYFGEGGEAEKSAEAANMFYDWVKEITGFELNGSDSSSSSMSNTIKGVTEQTADLIASYLNACRADLSVNRAMIAQYFPMFYQALTSSNGNLANIENHTAAIMRSNEKIAEKVSSLDDRISGLQSKTWKMPIA